MPANDREETGRGESGRKGADIRSDLHVAATLRGSGGVDVRVSSKVGGMYGDSIRSTAAEVQKALGVEHALLEIEDMGALPFVIAARVEAALRRAGATGRAPPEARVPPREASSRQRLRRSRLYLPGNQPKLFVNAGLHRPDAVILDLEDSVHPDDKDGARLIVRNALGAMDFLGAERMVRINQGGLGLDDLDEVVPAGPDLILIPKVEAPDQVRAVHERVEFLRTERTVERPIWLMPIVESALGVERAYDIANAADSVVALTIGLEDYTADLGVPRSAGGAETHYARTRLVNAARAAGVQAIDSVFSDVADTEGLLAWGRSARALGFEGMGCIHPRQIRPIHEAFSPTAAELDKALRIVAAFEDAETRGLGVVSLGTKMIDAPVVLRARRVVDQARAMGLLPEHDGDDR
jgi:citrate lyase subunit beta/citryl-CoA lyase